MVKFNLENVCHYCLKGKDTCCKLVLHLTSYQIQRGGYDNKLNL